ncbi:MAG: hypothetical protein NWE87_06230, partial [Candidatus Bathyarchaeota archaeon]|nr:hypothetical protein [Candidatus Bathyarchaeota archaeon]
IAVYASWAGSPQHCTQDSLLAVGQTLPGGIDYPQDHYERFQIFTFHPPFPGFAWRDTNLHPFGIVPTLLSLLTDINNPFLSFNSNIYKVYLDFIIPRSHPPWSNRGPWGVPLPCFNSKTLLLFQKILFLPI